MSKLENLEWPESSMDRAQLTVQSIAQILICVISGFMARKAAQPESEPALKEEGDR